MQWTRFFRILQSDDCCGTVHKSAPVWWALYPTGGVTGEMAIQWVFQGVHGSCVFIQNLTFWYHWLDQASNSIICTIVKSIALQCRLLNSSVPFVSREVCALCRELQQQLWFWSGDTRLHRVSILAWHLSQCAPDHVLQENANLNQGPKYVWSGKSKYNQAIEI